MLRETALAPYSTKGSTRLTNSSTSAGRTLLTCTHIWRPISSPVAGKDSLDDGLVLCVRSAHVPLQSPQPDSLPVPLFINVAEDTNNPLVGAHGKHRLMQSQVSRQPRVRVAFSTASFMRSTAFARAVRSASSSHSAPCRRRGPSSETLISSISRISFSDSVYTFQPRRA